MELIHFGVWDPLGEKETELEEQNSMRGLGQGLANEGP